MKPIFALIPIYSSENSSVLSMNVHRGVREGRTFLVIQNLKMLSIRMAQSVQQQAGPGSRTAVLAVDTVDRAFVSIC